MFNTLKTWARNLKRQIFVLYLAYQDKRVPLHAKIFTAFIVAYAFSPIDLIPDFIPVLGYLDDLILVPLGVMLALKMIPEEVITECEVKAEALMKKGKPKNWLAGFIILLIWIVIAAWVAKSVCLLFGQP